MTFYQVMWKSSEVYQPGIYFETLDEGVKFLEADAKERSGPVYTPFMAHLETREFNDDNIEGKLVAKQVVQYKGSRKIIVLTGDKL